MRRVLLFASLLVVSTFSFAGEQVLYVQSAKAKLMDTPNFKAEVIGELDKGTEVTVLQKEKRWVEVEHQGRSGWLSRLLLSTHPPLKKITVLGESEAKGIEENARRRASAVTTAGAARGLSADDRKRSHSGDKSDYFALEQVEKFQVEEQEVSDFIHEGANQ